MTTLVFSSDLSFGDFLTKSLNQCGIIAKQAISFSETELSLYKSEPSIAVFVNLHASMLAKLGRATASDCNVLVIGDATQRTIIPSHWKFVTTQTSIDVLLATIESFFPSLEEATLSLDDGNSSCLAEHFSTSATAARDSQHFLEVIKGKKKIGVYGLSKEELTALPSTFQRVSDSELSTCDVLLVRPDESSHFLSFLQRSQSFLPTAFLSLGSSALYSYLGCSIFKIDSMKIPDLSELLRAASRENGPRYVSETPLSKETQGDLNALGCTYGSPSDFIFSDLESPLSDENSFSSKSLALPISLGEVEKRLYLWTRAALVRYEEARKVRHLPELVSSFEKMDDPYLLKFSTSSLSFGLIASTLKEYFNVSLLSLSGALFGVCEQEDLEKIQSEIKMLESWTGRDKEGRGWFPKIGSVAIKSSTETLARDLIRLSGEKSESSTFTIIENDLSRVH